MNHLTQSLKTWGLQAAS